MISLNDDFTVWHHILFGSARCLVMAQIQFSLIKKQRLDVYIARPPTSDNISFLPFPTSLPSPPPQSGHHMCHPLYTIIELPSISHEIVHYNCHFWDKITKWIWSFLKSLENQSIFGKGDKSSLKRFKGYLRHETILYHKLALDVQLMDLFIWRKNISFPRYQGFCLFMKPVDLWRHYKYCCIMQVTLLPIAFEPYILSKWNLVKY